MRDARRPAAPCSAGSRLPQHIRSVWSLYRCFHLTPGSFYRKETSNGAAPQLTWFKPPWTKASRMQRSKTTQRYDSQLSLGVSSRNPYTMTPFASRTHPRDERNLAHLNDGQAHQWQPPMMVCNRKNGPCITWLGGPPSYPTSSPLPLVPKYITHARLISPPPTSYLLSRL